jgi:Uma2 family endonuclease
MAMVIDARPLTRADILALPDDGRRHELVSGVHLVTPTQELRHQRILARLFMAVDPFITAEGLGELLWSPADLAFGEDEVLRPDLFLVPQALTGGTRWEEITEVLLVIEALSPGTAAADRGVKRDRFQRAGVPEYWILDLDAHLVERWTPGDARPEICHESLVWQPAGAARARAIDVAALFD